MKQYTKDENIYCTNYTILNEEEIFKKVTPKSSVLINSNADKLLLGNQLVFQHIDNKSKQQTIQKLRILNYEK